MVDNSCTRAMNHLKKTGRPTHLQALTMGFPYFNEWIVSFSRLLRCFFSKWQNISPAKLPYCTGQWGKSNAKTKKKNDMPRVRFELTTSASLNCVNAAGTVYKYGALTNCATGAVDIRGGSAVLIPRAGLSMSSKKFWSITLNIVIEENNETVNESL